MNYLISITTTCFFQVKNSKCSNNSPTYDDTSRHMEKNSKQPLIPLRIRNGNVFSEIRSAYNEQGFYYLVRTAPMYLLDLCTKKIPNYLLLMYYKWLKSSDCFCFQGKQYDLFFHTYCSTWKNERCVVLPIVCKVVQTYQSQNKNILEIGNVTSYYYNTRHDVLDKYEIMDNVINEDIAEFRSSKKYDLIFSIVTLQCVGWNEHPREKDKILRTVENLMKFLTPEGVILVIHGLGENKDMDKLITNGKLQFNKRFCLKRMHGFRWEQTSWENIADLEYNYSIPTANGVVIGIIDNNPKSNSTLFSD